METHDIRYFFLPYCLIRNDEGLYMVLNRHYKPLGTLSSEWVTYEGHPNAIHLDINQNVAKKLSWKGEGDIDRIYLYNDGTNPMGSQENLAEYFKRLGILMALRCSVP